MTRKGKAAPKEKKTAYIKFFAPVNAKTINRLMAVVEDGLKKRVERFVILMSSTGGSVGYGLSAYNFLRGIPAEIITHNFGSVDSVAAVIYCAGSKRLCVPHARFLLHGIGFNVPANARFDEKLLDERIRSLRIDRENISRVIADNCRQERSKVEQDMLEGLALNPQQAEDYGLVHEIQSELIQKGADLITITDQ